MVRFLLLHLFRKLASLFIVYELGFYRTLSNWNSEFDKWSPGIKKIAYVGKPKARKKLGLNIFSAENDCQVILTTFELATKDQQILAQVEWLYIIIDEGHRMKNINSKVSICLRKEYKSKHRLILSGTPLQVGMI